MWHHTWRHGLLALALAMPNVADACTLDALLRLPLERLLQLTISVQRAPRGALTEPGRTHGPRQAEGTHGD